MQPYYYNESTQETTWDPPAPPKPVVKETPAAASGRPAMGGLLAGIQKGTTLRKTETNDKSGVKGAVGNTGGGGGGGGLGGMLGAIQVRNKYIRLAGVQICGIWAIYVYVSP